MVSIRICRHASVSVRIFRHLSVLVLVMVRLFNMHWYWYEFSVCIGIYQYKCIGSTLHIYGFRFYRRQCIILFVKRNTTQPQLVSYNILNICRYLLSPGEKYTVSVFFYTRNILIVSKYYDIGKIITYLRIVLILLE